MKTTRTLLLAAVALAAGFAASVATAAQRTVEVVKATASDIGAKTHAAVSGFMASQGLALYALLPSSDAYTGKFPVRAQPTDSGIYEIAVPFNFPAANPGVGDIQPIFKIPVGVDLVDWDIVPEDADSNGAPTLAFTFGSLNAALTALVTTYKAAMTGAQTGSVERAVSSAALSESNATERPIGFVYTAAAATYVAGKKGVLVLRLHG